jgi:hypothetical protein
MICTGYRAIKNDTNLDVEKAFKNELEIKFKKLLYI